MKRNPVAKALRTQRQRIVRARKGKGSYSRKGAAR
jgi:stalled ribosome alternative rescue factor ArfA